MKIRVIGVAAGLATVAGLALFGQPPGDQWYQAIRSNDLAGLRSLADHGDVNEKDKRETTPLMFAAANGSVETVRALLDKGASVNAANAFGATALMLSVNEPEKARLLVERGADVNARSKMGRTPLLLAAASDGASATVGMLLEHGARADVRDQMMATPLIAATAAGDFATIRMLLEGGAGVNDADVAGNTPLMNAASNGSLPAVQLLLARGAKVNAVTPAEGPKVKNGPIALGLLTPLLLSASYGGPELVRTLLDAGAAIDAQDVRGMTPLMLAIATDRADARTVRLLVDRGADLKKKDRDGKTATDWARLYGAPEILRELNLKPERGTAKPAIVPTSAPAAGDTRQAAAKAIALLERSNGPFFREGGCISCHAQNISAMAVNTAGKAGIPVNLKAKDEETASAELQFGSLEQPLLQRGDPPVVEILMFALFQLAAEGVPPARTTDAMVYNIAAQQRQAGNWHVGGIARPPMEDGDFSRTAMGIRTLAMYGPPGRKAEFEARIGRAERWLANARPKTTEDLAMQLLGIKWAGGRVRQDGLRRLMAEQREDGGWAQTHNLASDAYATGEVLYTLHEMGLPASAPEYRRGLEYLQRTQAADGSWHVKSRAPKFQPDFDGGFAYGHDQWISSAATGWAAMALSYGAGPEKVAAAGR